MMKTVTGKIRAYLSEYRNLDELRSRDDESMLDVVSFSSHDLTANGYTVVGEAEVTMFVLDDEQLLSNRIASLTKQKQSVLAEAQAKATSIEWQIQQLLAITYKPEVEAA